MKRLLIATTRPDKTKEVKYSLANLNLRILTLNDFSSFKEPEETGQTYQENAVIKAKYYGKKTKTLTLSDDSGLEVQALNWLPGVKSHRYAKGNKARINKMLTELKHIPKNKRKARFKTAIALYNPKTNKTKITLGIKWGQIGLKPRGKHGFGYDSIFIPDGFNKSYAQLGLKKKMKINSRVTALEKMIKHLIKHES